jgi:hypothetical protein
MNQSLGIHRFMQEQIRTSSPRSFLPAGLTRVVFQTSGKGCWASNSWQRSSENKECSAQRSSSSTSATSVVASSGTKDGSGRPTLARFAGGSILITRHNVASDGTFFFLCSRQRRVYDRTAAAHPLTMKWNPCGQQQRRDSIQKILAVARRALRVLGYPICLQPETSLGAAALVGWFATFQALAFA